MSRQNDLEIEVLFDAPREEVFSNWTDADKIRTWFAPDGFEVTSSSVEARPGGQWRVTYRSAQGVEYVEYGEFRTVEAPERLVFTLTQVEGGRTVLASLVTVTFTSIGSGTRMCFHQTGFDTPARHDDFHSGWDECFRKLAGSLARSKPGTAASQAETVMVDAAATGESEIRALLEAWAAAVRRHDMSAILAFHARDIVMFDLAPPLQARGLDDYQKTWDLFFQYHKVSQAFDIEELRVVAGDGVGFAYGLIRCGATQDPGGFLFRVTIGLRKTEGEWCVVHEHHSLPAVDG